MRRAMMVLGFLAALLPGFRALGAHPEYTATNMNQLWAAELESRYLAAGYDADVAAYAASEDAYLTTMSCLNNAGQMAGQFNYHTENDPLRRAVLWDPVEGLRDLEIPGRFSFPEGLNDLGQVVGSASAPTYSGRGSIAFLWDANEGFRDLGDLSPVSSDQEHANDINNAGQVVGWGFVSDSVTHLFLGDSENGLQDLGVPMTTTWRDPIINDSGQIRGNMLVDEDTFETHPFLIDADGLHDLHPTGIGTSYVHDMNSLGQVVGGADGKACLWSNGGFRFLAGVDEAYPWAKCHFAWCVNDSGVILGRVIGSGVEDERYFLWDEENGVCDLESLLPSDGEGDINCVYDMNNQGWILAQGWDANHELSTFLLKPTSIPEPCVLASLPSVLAVIWILRCHRD